MTVFPECEVLIAIYVGCCIFPSGLAGAARIRGVLLCLVVTFQCSGLHHVLLEVATALSWTGWCHNIEEEKRPSNRSILADVNLVNYGSYFAHSTPEMICRVLESIVK